MLLTITPSFSPYPTYFARSVAARAARFHHWLLVSGLLLVANLAHAQAPIQGLPFWKWQNPLPTGYDLVAAHVFNDSTAIVVGGHGTALKTRDGGRTWQALHVGTTDRLTHVSFANALVGWVAVLTPPTDVYPITRPYGGIGEVRRTTDGGLTWTRQQIENSGSQIRTLKALSATEAYVSYEELICTNPNLSCGGPATPRLRHTTDGGQSWPLVNTANPLLNFVAPGMAVTTREVQGHNMVLRTRDGGQTFRDITPVVQQNRYFSTPVFVDSLHGWVASNTLYFIYPPNLYRTQDGGRTWTEQHARADFLNPERAILGLAFADSLHGVATLSGSEVVATADGGRTWTEGQDAVTYRGPGVSGPLWTTAGGHSYWNVGSAGRVNVSATDGRTWANRTRNQSAGIDDYGGNLLKQVRLLDATHGWAWGPRQLLRTASRGAQWDFFKPDSISGNPLTYGSVRAADFPDRDTGCVVVQSSLYNGIRNRLQAVVVRTTDGGQHWTPRLSLPQLPQQSYGLSADQGGVQALRFGTPRQAVLVGDSGTIFATQDGGLSWTRRASPTRHRLTDVAWAGPVGRTVYASGDSATLCRSDDGGQTWRLVRVDSASFMITPSQFWPAAFSAGTPVRGIVFTSPEVGYMPYSNGVAKTTNGGRTWASTTHLSSRSSIRGNGQRDANSLNLYFRSPREGWYFGDDSFRTTDAGLTWTKMPELGDVVGVAMSGGTLADSYNAWLVGYNGRILHYSEKFIQADTSRTQALSYCAGGALALAFTTEGSLSQLPADYRVQVSNRMGRFRKGETLTLTPTVTSTTRQLNVTLPASLATGTRYRVRVIVADSSVLGGDNERDLTVNALVTATIAPVGPSLNVCQGSNLTLSAPANLVQYQWSTGATTRSITVSTAGTYTVRGASAVGCLGPPSTPITVTVVPLPAQPVVQQVPGGPLRVSAPVTGAAYQWSLPTGPIPGATGATYPATGAAPAGSYTVVATVNGCASPASAPLAVVLATATARTAQELHLYPNPARTTLWLERPVGALAATLRLLDVTGRVVWQGTAGAGTTALPVQQVPAGLYLVRLQTSSGPPAMMRVLVEH